MRRYQVRARQQISIHAPTRGATRPRLFNQFNPRISIHAPTRGATSRIIDLTNNLRISIHAPTRGATARCKDLPAPGVPISIHAPTRGATTSLSQVVCCAYKFQSTLPREERRPADSYQIHYCQHFNPRSHERSDEHFVLN